MSQVKLKGSSVWVYSAAIDFRKSIDGIVTLIHAQKDLKVSEGIYVFFNRARDKLKILTWHGNGFVLLYKRLECGKFTMPANVNTSITIDEKELSWLLAGLDWEKMRNWNELEYKDYS